MTQPEVEERARRIFVPHHLLLPVLLRGTRPALPSPAPAQEKISCGVAATQNDPPVSGSQLE